MKSALALVLLFTACANDSANLARILPAGDSVVLAVAGDYEQTGVISAVGIPSLEITQRLIDGVVSGDPTLRKFGDRVFIINRSAHNIVILDAKSGQFVEQIATGAKSNPQDVAVYDNHLYVAALGRGAVLVFDLNHPNREPELLDVSKLDADDGIPDCNSLQVTDDKLVVVCGILDASSRARGNGKAAIFNLKKPKEPYAEVPLPDKNPFGWLEVVSPTEVLVPLVPSFADMKKGCLARINVNEKRAECLISNQALGGYASSYHATAAGNITVAVTTGFDEKDFGPLAQIVKISPENQVEITSSAAETRRFDFTLCPGGQLVFAEARTGLHVLDATGFELTTHPLDIGLAPVQNGLVCY